MLSGFENIGFWIYVFLVLTWLLAIFIALAQRDMFKRLVALGVFQVPLFVFYIVSGYVVDGVAPIAMNHGSEVLSNPLPHVLILTAIVVSLATMSVGLALCIRIAQSYGSSGVNKFLD